MAEKVECAGKVTEINIKIFFPLTEMCINDRYNGPIPVGQLR